MNWLAAWFSFQQRESQKHCADARMGVQHEGGSPLHNMSRPVPWRTGKGGVGHGHGHGHGERWPSRRSLSPSSPSHPTSLDKRTAPSGASVCVLVTLASTAPGGVMFGMMLPHLPTNVCCVPCPALQRCGAPPLARSLMLCLYPPEREARMHTHICTHTRVCC